jgi:maltooligosyltrehalose trehalohydrolase
MQSGQARRYPIGAEPTADGVHFRIWAKRRRRVAVLSDGREPFALEREEDGYFSGLLPGLRPGARYRFELDGEGPYPDPASRHQPEGPHGPSEVIDSSTFRWTDAEWRGPDVEHQVIYELHVGCYTPEGTYRALIEQLDALADLGVTCLELMPVADFPGTFGWGYDGVNLYAPTRLYGRPDDLRALVDAAHARGLSVILDVVYNHLGPDGNYLSCYSEEYVSKKYPNEWGDPLNFDDKGSRSVREFFVQNARYWIDEFHFDGLRLDATQSIHDASSPHLLVEIAAAVRETARGRRTLLVAENEPQHAHLVRAPERGGYGLDLLWNDDFHHSARVAVTGYDEAYFTDYSGSPQELLSAVKYGFLFQGQHYRWQKKRRGKPAFDLEPWRRVIYIQNHDQVANSATGARLHALTSPGRLRAITTLALLSPGTPMLFMGQEFAASAPFVYFAEHKGDLAASVRKGRHEFLSQFANIATEAVSARLAAPEARSTYERTKLDLSERDRHREVYALHRDLLALRRTDRTLRAARRGSYDGAVLAEEAMCVRFFDVSDEKGDDRLIIVNLGRQLHLTCVSEPLLAPIDQRPWRVLWSSESIEYGGLGTPAVERDDGSIHVPAHAAVVLAPGSPNA